MRSASSLAASSPFSFNKWFKALSKPMISDFSHQLSSDAAIVELMADLGDALNVNPNMLFLGGGNPAQVPEFEALIAEILHKIASDPAQVHKLIGVYQSPQGSERLIAALAHYFQALGWPVSERNICITNGSQSAFFILINLLAGPLEGKTHKRFCLPMLPEYLGYADQGLADDMFVGVKPLIDESEAPWFKYHIDFDGLERLLPKNGAGQVSTDIAALCVSRPTNPSGNVLTQPEMRRLGGLADEHGIPLIVDSAYGEPFPGIMYESDKLPWQANRIFVMSLSKLGLPGVRTGIVVADEAVIERMVKVNTVVSLANGNLGPALMSDLLDSGKLHQVCKQVLLPFYQAKRDFALECIQATFIDLDYRIHKPEGAFFLWLWFPRLSISSLELYERLKQHDVLIMDGEHFFFDEKNDWPHAKECIRLSYCASNDVLKKAIGIIATELNTLAPRA